MDGWADRLLPEGPSPHHFAGGPTGTVLEMYKVRGEMGSPDSNTFRHLPGVWDQMTCRGTGLNGRLPTRLKGTSFGEVLTSPLSAALPDIAGAQDELAKPGDLKGVFPVPSSGPLA